MHNLEVEFEVQPRDDMEALEYCLWKKNNWGSPVYLWVVGLLSLAGMVGVLIAARRNGAGFFSLAAIFLLLLLLLGFFVLLPWLSDKISLGVQWLLRKVFPFTSPRPDRRVYYITPGGVGARSVYGVCEIKWEEISKVEENRSLLYLHSPVFGIHYIPLRAFADPETKAAFIGKLREHC